MVQTAIWTCRQDSHITLDPLAPVCDDSMVSLPAAQRD